MRILHLLNTNKMSGAENVAADICMMFCNEHQMAYCSPKGPIEKNLIDRNVTYIPVKSLSIFEIKRVIKHYKPDIIHCHDVKATVIASIASRKIPFISHLHVNSDKMRRLSIKAIIYALSVRNASRIITVSETCLEDFYFSRAIKSKTTYLRNIVYTGRINRLMKLDNNNFYFDFLFLGRISYQKNPQRIAKIASLVLKQCPEAKFGIVGDGELRSDMESIFKNEGVSDRVTFTGKLEYPYKVLKNSKCLLMCSLYEGTPIAVLEAMSLGTPTVSTPTDGVCELIRHNLTGFLSDDDIELADYIKEIITNDELYNKLHNNVLKLFIQINNEEEYKKKLNDIYHKTVKHY